MSLALDSLFIDALSQSEDVMDAIAGRLYGTAIPVPDEDLDNTPSPYIVVTFDGLTNDSETKDDAYEGETDQVRIGLEITAETLGQLHDLTELVREVIHAYIVENGTAIVADYTFSAQAIMYDSMKPCYGQVLNYQCEAYNHLSE